MEMVVILETEEVIEGVEARVVRAAGSSSPRFTTRGLSSADFLVCLPILRLAFSGAVSCRLAFCTFLKLVRNISLCFLACCAF